MFDNFYDLFTFLDKKRVVSWLKQQYENHKHTIKEIDNIQSVDDILVIIQSLVKRAKVTCDDDLYYTYSGKREQRALLYEHNRIETINEYEYEANTNTNCVIFKSSLEPNGSIHYDLEITLNTRISHCIINNKRYEGNGSNSIHLTCDMLLPVTVNSSQIIIIHYDAKYDQPIHIVYTQHELCIPTILAMQLTRNAYKIIPLLGCKHAAIKQPIYKQSIDVDIALLNECNSALDENYAIRSMTGNILDYYRSMIYQVHNFHKLQQFMDLNMTPSMAQAKYDMDDLPNNKKSYVSLLVVLHRYKKKLRNNIGIGIEVEMELNSRREINAIIRSKPSLKELIMHVKHYRQNLLDEINIPADSSDESTEFIKSTIQFGIMAREYWHAIY